MLGLHEIESDILGDLPPQKSHAAHIGLLHPKVPDHRQRPLVAHGGPHVQLAVLPERNVHPGIFHRAPDIAQVVGHGQQRAQRAAALDLQRQAGGLLLQRVAHHGGSRQQTAQCRRGHRQGSVNLPGPLRQVSGGDGGDFDQAILGDGAHQLVPHSKLLLSIGNPENAFRFPAQIPFSNS